MITFLCRGIALASVSLALSGCSPLAKGHRSFLGDRARYSVDARTERAGGNRAPVPAAARAAPSAVPTPEEAATEAPTLVPAEKAAVSAAVYGARWCAPCAELHKTVLRLQAKGAHIEYRDLDQHPTPLVRLLPTVFAYGSEGTVIEKAVGLPDCKALLEKHFDSN